MLITRTTDGRVILYDNNGLPHGFSGRENVLPHPQNNNIVLITSTASPQKTENAYHLSWESVTNLPATDRADFIEQLNTAFFFELNGGVSPAVDNRIINLETNETIYEVFQIVGTDQTGQVQIPNESSVLFDRYENGIDALAVEIDQNQKPIDKTATNSSNQYISVDSFDNQGNYVLSSIPTDSIAIVFQLKIADKDKSNILTDSIVEKYDFGIDNEPETKTFYKFYDFEDSYRNGLNNRTRNGGSVGQIAIRGIGNVYLRLDDQVDSSASLQMTSSVNFVDLSLGQCVFECDFSLKNRLHDIDNKGFFRAGLHKHSTYIKNVTHAVALEARHDDLYSGGFWRTLTMASGTSTYTETNIPIELDTVLVFKIIVRPDNALFFINNIQVAQHTLNIPTVLLMFMISGTRETFNTTATLQAVSDWIRFKQDFINDRNIN